MKEPPAVEQRPEGGTAPPPAAHRGTPPPRAEWEPGPGAAWQVLSRSSAPYQRTLGNERLDHGLTRPGTQGRGHEDLRRLVGASHQWPRGHKGEAHGPSLAGEGIELRGLHETLDRCVLR